LKDASMANKEFERFIQDIIPEKTGMEHSKNEKRPTTRSIINNRTETA